MRPAVDSLSPVPRKCLAFRVVEVGDLPSSSNSSGASFSEVLPVTAQPQRAAKPGTGHALPLLSQFEDQLLESEGGEDKPECFCFVLFKS